MRKPLTFFELQLMQREHDSRNHTDIYTLPLFDKMNHYVLHYAKYAARLTPKKPDSETLKELKRTYIDAFLITLAASNALNIDLDIEMRKAFKRIPKNVNDFPISTNKMSSDDLRRYSKDVLIISNGAMADTMEKRDHLDDKDSRGILIKSLLEIMEMILRGSYSLGFDIVQASLDRRKMIADLKIT